MRIILPALTITLAFALGACSTAEKASDETGNAVEATGNALANAGGELTNAGDEAAPATSNVAEIPGNAASSAATGHDAWVGLWTESEGVYLRVSKGSAPNQYKLEMQYSLDDKGTFDGVGTAEGIAFTRPDGKHVLRATTRQDPGIGTRECLTVSEGEYYCRG